MKRPAGVSMLVWLMIGYGMLLLVPVAQLLRPDVGIGHLNRHLQQLLPSERTDTAGLLCFCGFGAVLSLLTASGLWLLKEPARWGLLVIAGLPVVRGVLRAAALFATDSDKIWKQMGDGFWLELAGYGLLILYLFRPDVQLAFVRGDRYEGAFDPGKKLADDHDYDREQ